LSEIGSDFHDAFHRCLLQDGLFIVTDDPGIIHGYQKVILTPNVVEFGRLFTALVSLLLPVFQKIYLFTVSVYLPVNNVISFSQKEFCALGLG